MKAYFALAVIKSGIANEELLNRVPTGIDWYGMPLIQNCGARVSKTEISCTSRTCGDDYNAQIHLYSALNITFSAIGNRIMNGVDEVSEYAFFVTEILNDDGSEPEEGDMVDLDDVPCFLRDSVSNFRRLSNDEVEDLFRSNF